MNPIMSEWLTRPGGLARRLHGLRREAGLSGKQLAEVTGFQASKVSRVENGRTMPSAEDIEVWVAACGASDVLQELLDLHAESDAARVEFRYRLRRGQTGVQASYVELLQETRRVRYFEMAYVPGLLQIADYARHILTEIRELHELDVDDVDEAVAMRMQRQQMLYDSSRSFEFLLAEPVLRWGLCPPEVMRGQLDRLLAVLGLPHVLLGVIPLGSRLSTAPQNSFVLYDDTAIVETFVGETVHGDIESAGYARAMDRLWAEALTGENARRLILAAADDDLPGEPV